MTVREINAMGREIGELSRRLERIRSDAVSSTHALSDMPSGSSVADKTGQCISEIVDLERRIAELRARRGSELMRLSKYVDEENCIYLHFVRGYTWRRIAHITGGRMDTVESIKKRCYRHVW